MKRSLLRLAGVALAAALGLSGGAKAAGGEVAVLDVDFSFEGPFGAFDQAQLQRGWQVYSEVCAVCHSLQYLAFRHLGDEYGPAFPPEEVEAIAAAFINQTRTVDEFGEPTTRASVPADYIPGPYANEVAAQLANGGAVPPDFSNIVNARVGWRGTFTQLMYGTGGPEYIYSVLMGYTEFNAETGQHESLLPPEGFDVGLLSYNRYMSGHRIAMGQPLWPQLVVYQDGTEATIPQMAEDVTAFLVWAADPELTERKAAGVRNMLFLGLFAVLLWFSNRQLWKPVKEGGVG